MSDVSNKTIVGLLAVALVVTVVGTVVSVSKLSDLGGHQTVTGAASTASGTASLTVAYTVGIRMNDSTASFGSGYVNPGNETATIYTLNNKTVNSTFSGTNGELRRASWTISSATSDPQMQIVNNGNVDVRLTAKSNLGSAEEFYCGSILGCTQTDNKSFLGIYVENHETNSCAPSTGKRLRLYNHTHSSFLNDTNHTVSLCSDFNWENSYDTLNVSFNATVPFDASVGALSATVTFTASSRSES